MDAQGRNPRLRTPNRSAALREAVIDDLLPPDHQARVVVQYVASLDLSRLLKAIRAVEGTVGRNATDPAVLLALWMYAVLEGVGSARLLQKLTLEHAAYKWIAGGLTFCHRLLSSFRSSNGELFNDLIKRHVAALMNQGLVTLECIAQDGMRVRASAGEDTFRRVPSLEEAERLVLEQLEQMRRQDDEDPDGPGRRERAARERRALDRLERIQRAKANAEESSRKRSERIKRMPGEAKQRKSTGEGRASATDPDARKMKMPGGGFRPGLNVQAATTVGTGVIVAYDVVSQGVDQGLLRPMIERIEATYGERPTSMVVDGGYMKGEDVEEAHSAGVRVYCPVMYEKKDLAKGRDPYASKKRDGDGMKDLRRRMGSEEGKATYRLRAQTAEWANAGMRQRGLYQFSVRGLEKARAVVALHVLVHNMRQGFRLQRASAA